MTKKRSVRAGVLKPSPRTGSTAPRRRVSRTTKSERRTPKPKTAYELLERVCDHILEEPKRYTQESYLVNGAFYIEQSLGLSAPACGTVACRAGWIVVLHDGKPALHGYEIASRASQILDVDDTDDLFSGSACDLLAGENTSPIIGTKKYARLGVKGLRQFMRKHAAHLKARLLSDVPKLEGQD